jgi:phospholipase/carboxylesterase
MQWKKYKSLDYLCQTNKASRSCVVLFHGYGADAQDLASLRSVYRLDESVDWFFPQGVLEVPVGPMMSGRAWFQIRVSDYQSLANSQVTDVPVNKDDALTLDRVSEWLNELGHQYEQVFIGGFSQGAILTSHIFYRLRFCPKGLILFSGFLLHPSAFPVLPKEQRPPFFQSHGQQDSVLAIGGAQKLFDKLKDLGLQGQWMPFQGGHEIPMAVIQASNKFLSTHLEPGE